ncbi:MAG: hypothetical protein B6229_04440 [Spirochaetaceae bacterium 4572_7]|nr:MAG: hypothetical protein B6229_04440 [Spirochaetaceae bacterium 4572_7]
MNISGEWRHVILTLPDNYFFELMKNYLGRIQTPFNKHELVDKLASFLSQHNAEDKILNSLDQKERLILTSIEFISIPTAKNIYDFFIGEIPFIELCDTLKTLEEKLIIYSDTGVIFLSPLFADQVRTEVVNPGLLYKSEKIEPTSGEMIWLTDGVILSFLSFLIHQKDLIKSSGAFKKKAFNQIELLYPHLFIDKDGESRLTQIRRIIHNLRLVRIEGTSLIPRDDIWDNLKNLATGEGWLYMVAAATTESTSHLGNRITTIKRIIQTIPKDRGFYPDNLKKLIKALNSDHTLLDNSSVTDLIDDLIVLKVLLNREDGTITINPILDLENLNPNYGDINPVILQGNFDVTYKPWISIHDGYLIAIFCKLKKMDIYTELELTKESFIKGLTLSSSSKFIELLAKISGHAISDNVLLTLKEWEKETQKARHYEASILLVDEDKDFILKETGIIKDYIILNPSPGIYLINPKEYKQVQTLLESVDIYPIDKSHTPPTETETLPEYTDRPPLVIDWESKTNNIITSPENLEGYIRDISATKDEKDDLVKRIKRGIIFTKEQIQPGISKTDFSEAKGVNYQAKLRLIEVSLKASNNRLEINYVKDFKIHKELILPIKIEKIDDKKILHGQSLPDEEDFSIDIGKISLVRRVQTTLF